MPESIFRYQEREAKEARREQAAINEERFCPEELYPTAAATIEEEALAEQTVFCVPWYHQPDELAAFAAHLITDRGMSADKMAQELSKPWRWEKEFRQWKSAPSSS